MKTLQELINEELAKKVANGQISVQEAKERANDGYVVEEVSSSNLKAKSGAGSL